MNRDNPRCESCGGRGMVTAFVHREGSGCSGLERLPCLSCEGYGVVSVKRLALLRRGRAIQEARVSQGKLLREFAADLEIKPSALSDLENGRSVSPALYERAEVALGIT